MTKLIFSLLFLFITLGSATAQNYSSVNPQRTVYFKSTDNKIQCFKIDSTKGSNIYPNRNIQGKFGCYTPFGASWIGDRIEFSLSIDKYFNKKNNAFTINLNAQLNESWLAYEETNTIKIIAKVSSKDTITFLGLADSVKTISFQAYDNSMNAMSHSINNATIKLSKNYGIIKALNFYQFPDNIEEFTIAGMSNPSVGIQNLTWLKVHDYNIDDEIHTLYSYYHNNGSNSGTHIETKTIMKYLDRIDYADSIVYKVAKKESKMNKNLGNNTVSYSFTEDTILKTIHQNTSFDHLPGEPVITNSTAFAYEMQIGNFISKTNDPYKDLNKVNDTCWTEFLMDGCFPEYTYHKGLGGPYYSCDEVLDDLKNELIYYKKGNVTWGTPLLITGTSVPSTDMGSIEVYPNPVKDLLQIKSPGFNKDLFLTIRDIQGHIILENTILSDDHTINFTHLSPGLYFYQIRNERKVIKEGKVLKM